MSSLSFPSVQHSVQHFIFVTATFCSDFRHLYWSLPSSHSLNQLHSFLKTIHHKNHAWLLLNLAL